MNEPQGRPFQPGQYALGTRTAQRKSQQFSTSNDEYLLRSRLTTRPPGFAWRYPLACAQLQRANGFRLPAATKATRRESRRASATKGQRLPRQQAAGSVATLLNPLPVVPQKVPAGRSPRPIVHWPCIMRACAFRHSGARETGCRARRGLRPWFRRVRQLAGRLRVVSAAGRGGHAGCARGLCRHARRGCGIARGIC